jgi:hypothetical protein
MRRHLTDWHLRGRFHDPEVQMASMDVPAGRPVAVPAAKPAAAAPTYITWLTLAFMTTASVASLRSAPTMAVYGLTCVFP